MLNIDNLSDAELEAIKIMTRRINEATSIGVRYLNRETVDSYLDEAEQAVLRTLVPVGPERIYKGLSFVVDMLGCKMPSDMSMRGFQKLLSRMPRDLWERSLVSVLENHSYSKLPTPAEFINPIRAEWTDRCSFATRVEIHRSRLELSERLNHKDPIMIKVHKPEALEAPKNKVIKKRYRNYPRSFEDTAEETVERLSKKDLNSLI